MRTSGTSSQHISRKRITRADVALAAGCSPAVVSTVINGAASSAGASPELAQRIREAAASLGYRPDFASQSLARRSTQTIGVYVPPQAGSSLTYRYEATILRGIEHVCQEHNYDLLAINLGGTVGPESCLYKFTERRIDGLIVLHVPDDAGWVAPLLDHYPHVMTVNYYGPVSRLTTINFDDRAAAAMAVEHLVGLGHRNIAYIGPSVRNPGPGAQLRCEGFRRAMQSHGLPMVAQWVWGCGSGQAVRSSDEWDFSAGSDPAIDCVFSSKVAGLPTGNGFPTALVCYNDLIAIQAVQLLKRRGLSIPRDVSVIGIDDREMCRYLDPPLTTIRQPLEDMGRQITTLLFEQTAGKESARAPATSLRELIAPSLVVRQSTASPQSSGA